jgi:hypothetical protein
VTGSVLVRASESAGDSKYRNDHPGFPREHRRRADIATRTAARVTDAGHGDTVAASRIASNTSIRLGVISEASMKS